LGSQAPLFYGPIQEGKDGWNAAFFCGSNAVLRREALMQLGIVGYVRSTERAVGARLRDAASIVRRARRRVDSDAGALVLEETANALRQAQKALGNGEPLAEVTYALKRSVDAAAHQVVTGDLSAMRADLAELGLAESTHGASDSELLALLTHRDLSPLNALGAVQVALHAIEVSRSHEAQPVLPLATNSVTEDMSTSMRLHSQGWSSVFHNELLADGLAPEDLGTMLTQRLRWAQGTMQVFLRENPLLIKGLSLPQRLMYFSTMWSYLSGFATIVYLAAPVIFLTVGVLPVRSFAPVFFVHFIPFLVMNQLLFLVAARGIPTWRGQQYNLALFPVWIRAFLSAAGSVFFKRTLSFAVTSKTRTQGGGTPLRHLRWQIAAAVILVIAIVIGIVRLTVLREEFVGTFVNLVWVAYDFATLSVLIGAVRYRGYRQEGETI
jgi:cellulose synthase (UDP-forming)